MISIDNLDVFNWCKGSYQHYSPFQGIKISDTAIDNITNLYINALKSTSKDTSLSEWYKRLATKALIDLGNEIINVNDVRFYNSLYWWYKGVIQLDLDELISDDNVFSVGAEKFIYSTFDIKII